MVSDNSFCDLFEAEPLSPEAQALVDAYVSGARELPAPAPPQPGDHRWSGWPGAWCLDCGAECKAELACCDPRYDVETGEWEGGSCPPEYVQEPCPCQGSRHCDPYATLTGDDV